MTDNANNLISNEHKASKRYRLVKKIQYKSKKTYSELMDNKAYYAKLSFLVSLYSTLLVLYFVIDAIYPFYNKTKFGFEFTINNMKFSFPSTSSSFITTLFIQILSVVITTIIFRMYKNKKNEEKKTDTDNSNRANLKELKLVICCIIVASICEILKNTSRELNGVIKNSLASSIAIELVIALYLVSFLLTLSNRIVNSYKNDATKKLDTTDLSKFSAQEEFISRKSIKKGCSILLSWKKVLSLTVVCGVCFGITALVQQYSRKIIKDIDKFKLALPFKIGGNTINILDNENNILLTMFVDLLLMNLAFMIVKYLNEQEKKFEEYKKHINDIKECESKIQKLKNENHNINYDQNTNIEIEALEDKLKTLNDQKENFNEKNDDMLQKKNISLKNSIIHAFSPKNIANNIMQTVLLTVFTNILTAVRRSMQKFDNKESIGAWAVCWIIIAIAFIFTTKSVIKSNDMITGEKKQNTESKHVNCLICFEPKKNQEIKIG